MNNSQIIWIQNLNESSLKTIGEALFLTAIDHDTKEALVQDDFRDPRLDTQILVDAAIAHQKVL